MASVTRTCIGTAGENVPLVKDWLRESITARVGGELLILGDVEIALDAAFPGRAGVLVLAGTGSNVVGPHRWRTADLPREDGGRRSRTRDPGTESASKAYELSFWPRTKSGIRCFCRRCWNSGSCLLWITWWNTRIVIPHPIFQG